MQLRRKRLEGVTTVVSTAFSWMRYSSEKAGATAMHQRSLVSMTFKALAFQLDLQCLSFVRGNGVINEAGCWNYLVGMTLGAIHVSQVPETGWARPLPPPIGCNLSTSRKRKPK